jgi:L-amino acid N-acyltransferase YncA
MSSGDVVARHRAAGREFQAAGIRSFVREERDGPYEDGHIYDHGITHLHSAHPQVRPASAQDAAACAAIYAPYVTDTAISFETDPPSPAEMADRISAASRGHAWLVLEDEGRVVGYAYGARFHRRGAYRWACEVSVYLELGRRRTGGGRALYEALLERLTERGFRVAVAGMTLPNDASVGLHRAMGFEPVGTYRRIGFKHGSWHDVAWTQRILATGVDPPPEPR